MKTEYFPNHSQNRMKHEGDVKAARDYFMRRQNKVLYRLIEQRFLWMNQFIKNTDENIIEVGCGAGLSKEFIKSKKLILTDVTLNEWVDKRMDALDLDCKDESLDVVICCHMIHHIAKPALFLEHVGKKLKPGGRIIIQDIYTCMLMKLVLRIMRHEGWSDKINIFDRSEVCNIPDDPWSANCSIPKLLFFGDKENFYKEFPMFRMVRRRRNECFLFLLSGGVIAKTFFLPIGDSGISLIKKIDHALIRVAPSLFACGCSIVLEKR